MKKLTISMTRTETAFGIFYLGIQLLVLPYLLVLGNRIFGNALSKVQLNFLFFAIDFICIAAIFRGFLKKSAVFSLEHPWRILRYAGCGLLLYWAGSFLVNVVILNVYPVFSNVNDQSILELAKENYSLMAIGTVFLVPVVEETLHRGVIFGTLYRVSPLVGYLVSTLIFSALHIISYINAFSPLLLLLCFLQYIPAGLCLAWAYVKADSIWAPILIHIAINKLGVLAMR